MKQDQKILLNQVKNYWNENSCNSDLSEKPWGTREFFEEQEHKKYLVESHIPKFAEFGKWKGKKVLEIGCGMGSDTVNFARAGAWVTSVDLTPRSLELTQKRLEVYGLSDRVKLYEANAEELSSAVPVETFDLIYSFGVIHHSPNPEKILEQMRLYADENTVLKIMVYYLWSFNMSHMFFTMNLNEMIARTLRLFKGEHLALDSESVVGCPVTYVYSKTRFFRILREQGFFPVDSWVSGLNEYEYTTLEKTKRWENPILKFMKPFLNSQFGWNLCVTAQLSHN